MSMPRQEAHALQQAERLLLDLGNGTEKRIPTVTRRRARDVMRHFPIDAAGRWLAAQNQRAVRRYAHDPAHHPVECLEAVLWDLAGEGPEHRDENLSHGLVALVALQQRAVKQIETALAAVESGDSTGLRQALAELAVLLDPARRPDPAP